MAFAGCGNQVGVIDSEQPERVVTESGPEQIVVDAAQQNHFPGVQFLL